MQSWSITNKPKAGLHHNLHYCRVLREISSDRLKRKREYLLGVDAEMLHVLSQLRSNGWTIGIVSNATPDEVADWSECPLRDAVDDAFFHVK